MGGRGSSGKSSDGGAMKIPLSRIEINMNEYIFWHGERHQGYSNSDLERRRQL